MSTIRHLPAWVAEITLTRGFTGTPVRAFFVRGDGAGFDSVARSEPWQLGDGTWVALIEGKSGGWRCDCLEDPAAMNQAARVVAGQGSAADAREVRDAPALKAARHIAALALVEPVLGVDCSDIADALDSVADTLDAEVAILRTIEFGAADGVEAQATRIHQLALALRGQG